MGGGRREKGEGVKGAEADGDERSPFCFIFMMD